MDLYLGAASEFILFFILYSVTAVVPLIAALYLLLRRGNAFAFDVTPPVRLRRWAALFFAVVTLSHVWWMVFYINHSDPQSLADSVHSAVYYCLVVLDYVTLLTTVAGTLLAMLQDRRRPVWPVFAAMIPFVAMGVVLVVTPGIQIKQIAFAYVLLLYVLFTVYEVFAVRQYGRWLNDNYADLEDKKVWLTHVLSLVFMLLFISYAFVDIDTTVLSYNLIYVLELALFGLLLWRVETLPTLEEIHVPELSAPLPDRTTVGYRAVTKCECWPTKKGESPFATESRQGGGSINLDWIEQMLKEHCVDKQLYLQHDLSLQQLAQAVGTNRFYLSQYFSRLGITYNIYINNLRINYFVGHYQDVAASGQPFTVQQLASESGFRSYRTFQRAFKQYIGQSVAAWTVNN